MNGKRFRIDEAEVGVNYPTMHPNCRSTTQLVLDENYKKEEREAAKNAGNNDIKEFRTIEKQAKQDISEIKEVETIEKRIKEIGGFRGEINLKDMPLPVAQNTYITSTKFLQNILN